MNLSVRPNISGVDRIGEDDRGIMGEVKEVLIGYGRSVGLICLFIFSLTAVWGMSPASADQFGMCNATSGCRADNFEHTYCYGGSLAGDGFQTAAGYGMSNLVAQTKFTKTYMSSCSSNTDVVFKRDDSINAYADTLCMAFVSGTNKCNRARVRFNGKLLNALGQPMVNKKSTACHEVGHTGGLAHGTPSDCMTNVTPTTNVHYNAHHKSHLNNQN